MCRKTRLARGCKNAYGRRGQRQLGGGEEGGGAEKDKTPHRAPKDAVRQKDLHTYMIILCHFLLYFPFPPFLDSNNGRHNRKTDLHGMPQKQGAKGGREGGREGTLAKRKQDGKFPTWERQMPGNSD